MTTKDSAGDKLVASIRKTKSASVTTRKTTKKKVVKKATQSSNKKVIPEKSENVRSNSKARIIDLFQSGRRVWPD